MCDMAQLVKTVISSTEQAVFGSSCNTPDLSGEVRYSGAHGSDWAIRALDSVYQRQSGSDEERGKHMYIWSCKAWSKVQ